MLCGWAVYKTDIEGVEGGILIKKVEDRLYIIIGLRGFLSFN